MVILFLQYLFNRVMASLWICLLLEYNRDKDKLTHSKN